MTFTLRIRCNSCGQWSDTSQGFVFHSVLHAKDREHLLYACDGCKAQIAHNSLMARGFSPIVDERYKARMDEITRDVSILKDKERYDEVAREREV